MSVIYNNNQQPFQPQAQPGTQYATQQQPVVQPQVQPQAQPVRPVVPQVQPAPQQFTVPPVSITSDPSQQAPNVQFQQDGPNSYRAANTDEVLAHARSLDEAGLRNALATIRDKAAECMKQAGPAMDLSKVTLFEGRDAGHALQEMHEQAKAYAAVLEEKQGPSEIASRIIASANGALELPDVEAPFGQSGTPQSIGDIFVNSEAYKNAKSLNGSWYNRLPPVECADASIDILRDTQAATFQRTAGWPVETIRSGRVELQDQRPIQLIDRIPMVRTTRAGTKYMQETTVTNAAAFRSEGGSFAESTLALSEVSATIESVGTHIPVTDEQLEDETMARDYLNSRVPFLVRQQVDNAILNGNGTAPNIRGFRNFTGVLTLAKTSQDTLLDIFVSAMTSMRKTAFMYPDTALITPDTMQAIATAKDTQNRYLFGNPNQALSEGMRLWGLQLITNDSLPANTAFMGGFRAHSALLVRKDITLSVGFINDQFIKNMQTIKADMRLCTLCYRPTAFLSLTALNT